MFSHVMVGADDVEASKKFYDAILGALGHGAGVIDAKGRCFYFTKSGNFAITKPIDGKPASVGNGNTIGFAAADPAAADAWHAAGLANGGSACEDSAVPRLSARPGWQQVVRTASDEVIRCQRGSLC
jgi:catechol 2,3-dioxygenase-like lactoylglutathione lyase family enzyme